MLVLISALEKKKSPYEYHDKVRFQKSNRTGLFVRRPGQVFERTKPNLSLIVAGWMSYN